MKSKVKISLKLCLLMFIAMMFVGNVQAQYVRQQGNQIVDPNGNPLFFKGMNLGNWLLWEGYLMMGDYNYRTHTQFFNSVRAAFGGNQTQALDFEHQWRMNYVTEQAIIDLKNMGFNSVRVPFHYNMFWNGSAVTNNGFQYFDRVITFCRNQGMYVLLDMHAAPGYQNPGDHSDNVESNKDQPRDKVYFWDGNNVNIASQVWRHIATRYANEPVVWGYDLINEPVPQPGREFELLGSMITMRNAIRQVDNNHIIVAEGTWWGSDMQKLDWMDPQTQAATGVTARWDNNMVYQTHHYSSDVSLLTGRLAITNKLGVPLILGEYGESTDQLLRQMTDWCINNNVGYFPWSFKKMIHDKCLWTIPSNSNYDAIRNFVNNGGTPPANAYNNMISFCNNNIANGKPGLVFHQSWYDAVKPPVPPTRFAIPGTVQAEEFSAQSGIQLETTSDTGGGQNVGFIEAGDWTQYLVNVATAGTYQIQYRVASTGTTGQIQLVNGSTVLATTSVPNTNGWQTWTTITASATLPAGQHTLRLNFPGGSFNLNWFSFTSGTPSIPSVPTGLNATPGNAQVSVSWAAASGATSYTVKRSTTSGGTYTNVATNVTATSYTNTGLTNGTTYYFVVSASNSAGSSANSNPVSATPQAPSTPPGVPTNLSAAAGNAQVALTWTASSGAASYTVKRSTTSGGPYSNIATGVTATSYTNTGLSNGTTYYYVVSAVNPSGESANSSPANATPSSGTINAFATIEAESYSSMSGIQTESCSEGGLNVGHTDSNDFIAFNNVNFGTGAVNVDVRVASAASFTGTAQFRLGSVTGTLIGTVSFGSTGGWQTWVTKRITVSGATGTQNLFLVFQGGAGIANINWIKFNASNNTSAFSTIEAESFTSMNGIQVEACSEGGSDVGWTDANDFIAFNNIDFGTGALSADVRIASGASFTGTAQLRLGSTTGTLIGTVSFGNTGGWQTWVTRNVPISNASGVANLYMVFQGGAGIGNVNWIRFKTTSSREAVRDLAQVEEGSVFSADIYPNPGNGKKVALKLLNNKTTSVAVKVMDAKGVPVLENQLKEGADEIQFQRELPAGVYFVVIESGDQKLIRRLVVK